MTRQYKSAGGFADGQVAPRIEVGFPTLNIFSLKTVQYCRNYSLEIFFKKNNVTLDKFEVRFTFPPRPPAPQRATRGSQPPPLLASPLGTSPTPTVILHRAAAVTRGEPKKGSHRRSFSSLLLPAFSRCFSGGSAGQRARSVLYLAESASPGGFWGRIYSFFTRHHLPTVLDALGAAGRALAGTGLAGWPAGAVADAPQLGRGGGGRPLVELWPASPL